MKRITYIIIISFITLSITKASSIKVSSGIGFDISNSTSFLQFALESTTEDTIIIDNVGNDWMTGPLRIERNDITILFEDSVTIRALPGEFEEFESLFRIVDKENINLIGYGAQFIMNKQEYISLADSEYRHGINLGSATNITIEGLSIFDTGGDGILISKSFQPNSVKNYSENILIKNCLFSNNYRQGMSIVSVKNAQIINCEFSETKGTLPEAGIDIEPDDPTERIENVLIKGCRIFNNYGNAIQLALFQMDDSSLDVSITIEDTYMSNNHHPSNVYVYAEIAATDNKSNGVDGFANFNNCYVENSQWSALYVAKTVESYDLNFTNCIFKDISNDPIAFNSPIFFEVTDYDNQVPRFGGVHFNDCMIHFDENIPFLDVYENSSTSDGLGNVTGNFYIINPNNIGFETGINPLDVNITFEHFDSLPPTIVSLSADQFSYEEEEKYLEFEVSRENNEELPIAFSLETLGEAQYGIDYYRAKNFIIMQPNETLVKDTIQILIDHIEEPSETLILSIVDNDCIEINSNNSITYLIEDMVQTSLNTMPLKQILSIFPNPTNKLLSIESNFPTFDLRIIDLTGKSIRFYANKNSTSNIDIGFLPNGMYIIEITSSASNEKRIGRIIKK